MILGGLDASSHQSTQLCCGDATRHRAHGVEGALLPLLAQHLAVRILPASPQSRASQQTLPRFAPQEAFTASREMATRERPPAFPIMAAKGKEREPPPRYVDFVPPHPKTGHHQGNTWDWGGALPSDSLRGPHSAQKGRCRAGFRGPLGKGIPSLQQDPRTSDSQNRTGLDSPKVKSAGGLTAIIS